MAGLKNSLLGMMILKLKKSNYNNGSIWIKTMLGAYNVWDIVEARYVEKCWCPDHATTKTVEREKNSG
jgi:hypothetical protein